MTGAGRETTTLPLRAFHDKSAKILSGKFCKTNMEKKMSTQIINFVFIMDYNIDSSYVENEF